MRQKPAILDLEPKQIDLIECLLRYATKDAAAKQAGVARATMYRWLHDPRFKTAYRAAQREHFDEHLAVLVKETGVAIKTLVKELKGERSVVAAKAIIDRAFRTMDSVVMQEELDNLRTLLEVLRAGQIPKPPDPPPAAPPSASNPWPAFSNALKPPEPVKQSKPPTEEPMAHDDASEAAEAARLRVAWMAELGAPAADIEQSLRYYRPQSVAEEAYLLDLVQTMLKAEYENAEITRREIP